MTNKQTAWRIYDNSVLAENSLKRIKAGVDVKNETTPNRKKESHLESILTQTLFAIQCFIIFLSGCAAGTVIAIGF